MARQIIVHLLGDSRSLERSFQRSARSAKKFQSDMKGLSGGVLRGAARGAGGGIGLPIFGGGPAVAGAVGAGAAVAGIKKAISAASDLNEQIGKTEVVFGRSGKAVEDWSKTLTNSFALSERQALATASSFGALFRPMGFTGEEAAKQSEKLTQLGADLASFYNTDVQSALDAIRSGLVGESEPLRQYGVLLSETRVQQEALVETGKKHASALTVQEKAVARLTLIFKDSKQAQGDSARSSERFAEQAKILSANIDTLAAHIGETLLPAVTDATKALNKLFEPRKAGKKTSQEKDDVSALGDAYHWVAHGIGEANKKSDEFDKLLRFPEKLSGPEKLFAPLLIGKEIRLIQQLLGKEPPALSTGKMNPEAAVKMAHGLGLLADGIKKVGAASQTVRATALQRNTWFDQMISRGEMRAGLLPTLTGQITALQKVQVLLKQRFAITKDVTRRATLEDEILQNAATISGLITQRTQDAKQAAEDRKQKAEAIAQAARDEAVAWADVAIQKAQGTASLQDDLKADRNKLRILQQQAAVGKMTAEKAAEIEAIQQDIAAKAEQARSARQFRELGFGPGGEKILPTAKQLRGTFGRLEDQIRGTPLDTSAMERAFDRVRKAIADGITHGMAPDVKQRILDMFDSWRQALEEGKKKLKPKKRDSNAPFMEIFDPGIWKSIRGELGPGNTLNGVPVRFVGPTATDRLNARLDKMAPLVPLTINGGIHLHGVQNVPQLENELVKHAKTRPQPRRGP